jgi:hypothetical protein
VGDDVVIVVDERDDIAAISRCIESSGNSMNQDWEGLLRDRQLTGELGEPSVCCRGKIGLLCFTTCCDPYVATPVTTCRTDLWWNVLYVFFSIRIWCVGSCFKPASSILNGVVNFFA